MAKALFLVLISLLGLPAFADGIGAASPASAQSAGDSPETLQDVLHQCPASKTKVTLQDEHSVLQDLEANTMGLMQGAATDYEKSDYKLGVATLNAQQQMRRDLAVMNLSVELKDDFQSTEPLSEAFTFHGRRGPISSPLPDAPPQTNLQYSEAEAVVRNAAVNKAPNWKQLHDQLTDEHLPDSVRKGEAYAWNVAYLPKLEVSANETLAELQKQAAMDYESLAIQFPLAPFLTSSEPTDQEVATAKQSLAKALRKQSQTVGATDLDKPAARVLVLFAPSVKMEIKNHPLACPALVQMYNEVQRDEKLRSLMVHQVGAVGAGICLVAGYAAPPLAGACVFTASVGTAVGALSGAKGEADELSVLQSATLMANGDSDGLLGQIDQRAVAKRKDLVIAGSSTVAAGFLGKAAYASATQVSEAEALVAAAKPLRDLLTQATTSGPQQLEALRRIGSLDFTKLDPATWNFVSKTMAPSLDQAVSSNPNRAVQREAYLASMRLYRNLDVVHEVKNATGLSKAAQLQLFSTLSHGKPVPAEYVASFVQGLRLKDTNGLDSLTHLGFKMEDVASRRIFVNPATKTRISIPWSAGRYADQLSTEQQSMIRQELLSPTGKNIFIETPEINRAKDIASMPLTNAGGIYTDQIKALGFEQKITADGTVYFNRFTHTRIRVENNSSGFYTVLTDAQRVAIRNELLDPQGILIDIPAH